MTLVLLCLSALTPFLFSKSNATKPPRRQPAVICCVPDTRCHDTPIMDLYVLLNKSHKECRDERESGFILIRARQSAWVREARVCHHQQKMDPYRWCIHGKELSTIEERVPYYTNSFEQQPIHSWSGREDRSFRSIFKTIISKKSICKHVTPKPHFLSRKPTRPYYSADHFAVYGQWLHCLQSSWKLILMSR